MTVRYRTGRGLRRFARHPADEVFDDDSVELFEWSTDLAVSTDGTDFLFLSTGFVRRFHADGTLEGPTEVSALSHFGKLQMSWAHETYHVVTETRSDEIPFAELDRDGSPVRTPLTLGEGQLVSMTRIGQDALVVDLRPQAPEPGHTWAAVVIHEGNISEPIPLPFLRSRPVLPSSGDRAYLARAVGDDITRTATRIHLNQSASSRSKLALWMISRSPSTTPGSCLPTRDVTWSRVPDSS